MDFGVLATAAFLGATHAIEPDHLAGVVGISGNTGGFRGALVGVWFAVGHVVLVVGWLGLGLTVLHGLPELTVQVGDAFLGVVLLITGALVGRDAVLTLRATPTRRRGDAEPLLARTDGGSNRLYGVGLVGAAFTLSPPLSMLGFLTGVLPRVGTAGAWMAVGTYAIAIVTGMATVGAAGGILGAQDPRVAVGAKVIASCLLAGLGVAMIV